MIFESLSSILSINTVPIEIKRWGTFEVASTEVFFLLLREVVSGDQIWVCLSQVIETLLLIELVLVVNMKFVFLELD